MYRERERDLVLLKYTDGVKKKTLFKYYWTRVFDNTISEQIRCYEQHGIECDISLAL